MPSGLSVLPRELRLARRELRQGRFERSMALMTAFAALVSGWEAYAQHQRGAFADWLMWTPVGLTPPTVIAGLGGVLNRRLARRVLPAMALVTIFDGLLGFALHIRGIRHLPGGFGQGRYNIVIGPPLFAPLLTCMVGVFGLLAAVLRPERLSPRRYSFALLQVLLDAARPPASGGSLPDRLAARIAHGRFQRVMALLAAVFAIFAGGEAYVAHLRGSFNRPLMWTPVWLTPPMVVAALGAALSERVARTVLPVVATVTFMDGLLGFGLHVQGLQHMPGGFHNLQFNFTMGPPVFAPLLFSSIGVLGFIAALARRPRRPW
ncbi:MAG: hypothetical protein M3069_25055 [Chloroflexota bacterium]|nr:hypothetical protein [Chloroflexota bacterium]